MGKRHDIQILRREKLKCGVVIYYFEFFQKWEFIVQLINMASLAFQYDLLHIFEVVNILEHQVFLAIEVLIDCYPLGLSIIQTVENSLKPVLSGVNLLDLQVVHISKRLNRMPNLLIDFLFFVVPIDFELSHFIFWLRVYINLHILNLIKDRLLIQTIAKIESLTAVVHIYIDDNSVFEAVNFDLI